jgi:hypothetical protein
MIWYFYVSIKRKLKYLELNKDYFISITGRYTFTRDAVDKIKQIVIASTVKQYANREIVKGELI